MKLYIGIICLLSFFIDCYAQSNYDNYNIKKNDSLINSKIGTYSWNNDFIVYSVGPDFMVIKKEKYKYRAYYAYDYEKRIESKYLKNNSILDKLFSLEINTEISNYSNNRYDYDCPSSYIYFSVHIKGIKKYEFNLPYALFCARKESLLKYPVNNDILFFLYELKNELNIEWEKFE